MGIQLWWFSFLGLVLPGLLVDACDGGHNHARRDDNGHTHDEYAHPTPHAALTPPTRPLEWGDINFIHTTDSHGWLLGHQKATFPEPNYSGTLGDFSSFVTHMKELADERNVDLLLIDSGDVHDGTGLSDGFPPGGVDAQDANEFIKKLPYDAMTIGNHELYVYNDTLDMYQNFAPALKGRYLSSNVNITITDQDGNAVSVPVGERFTKFTTKLGRKITSVGVLFDFTANDKGTTVQKVADMVKESWFLDAIQEEPDLFLLIGHMPVSRDNWPLVFNAVRAVHPTTPIVILGGHTHIRDCVQFDGRSMALESGRYLETVGWLSANLDKKGSTADIKFSRRYLDANRVTYEFHSQKNHRNFDTQLGQQITEGLHGLFDRFNLGFTFGTAPQDFFLSRVPYPSNGSLLSLFIDKALPTALQLNNPKTSKPTLFMINSFFLRFDLYVGPFTRDDQFQIASFVDSFLYLPDVPLSLAMEAVKALNNPPPQSRRSPSGEESLEERYFDTIEEYKRGDVERIRREWLKKMDRRVGNERRQGNLTLGYVTQDSCPGVGDDTLHEPLPEFDVPQYISSVVPVDTTPDTLVEFVFIDFIETRLLNILNSLQSVKVYATSDALKYSDVLSNAVLGIYAQQAWN
ncbi:hypothetical protein P691DRAFT_806595 [Macrolepiota fuliginosa MF-IS2]|uniref:Calcineurin-like phosphoesterase domain-containing protein n=1 Tax=Macrolepiota fuliginosa MF-IS2 TaxID=1400762 RepID=A0A9P5X693_9AGAR|nr:hypothetical protein P691DRAFT_806595 [Macrolepiota fuliginosa MF-IS2]